MKHFFTALVALASFSFASAQCTTTNATNCRCADPNSNDCDLLPDLAISWKGLLNLTEYPQTGAGTNYNGQGPDDGRLRLTGSTPNIGLGAFTVRGSNWYVCGTDTFQSTNTPGNCPDGTFPRQLITQRVYHKSGNAMTYTDRWAGSMTYHPSHGHNHVDDWSWYTLRIKNPNEPDPRKWPVVGSGSKQGFCLMDYYSCSNNNANGHCRDDNTVYNQGTALNSTTNFPNYGLGGGQYSCSPVEQGISSGWTDVYGKHLDMMWINIPPNICNGDYWVVAEVDPLNYFLESDDANNYTAIPVTLTQQSPVGTAPWASISSNKPANICQGDSVILTCNAGTSMVWSNGDTTQTIVVKNPGTYTVTVTNYCGVATSTPFVVTVGDAGVAPTVLGDTLCSPGSVTLNGQDDFQWYADADATTLLGSGSLFTTPYLTDTTTYYVRSLTQLPPDTYFSEPHSDGIGGGGFSNSDQYTIFDALVPFTIKTVKVNASGAGTRKVYLKNFSGTVLDSAVVSVPAGESRITVDLNVPAGNDFRLAVSANPNLYRNSGGVNYPYTVDGILNIKNSSAGNIYYYYFYDWEVETAGNTCATPLAPVTVVVGNTPEPTIAGLAAQYELTDSPVALTGNPAGGTFSGQGVSGNNFDPAVAGVGTYVITYTYSNGSCSASVTDTVTVVNTVGVNNIEDMKTPIQVYPNPSNGAFTLSFETKKQHSLRLNVTDLTGRTIWSEDVLSIAGKYIRTFTSADLASGVYLLNVIIDGKPSVRKLVVN